MAERTGKRKNIDISNPIYKVPFEFGWQREIVYRKPRSKKTLDVYYYRPKDLVKLRSKTEIQRYLIITNNRNLTTDNFTFKGQEIGLNDPTKERIIDKYNVLKKNVNVTSRVAKKKKMENGQSQSMKMKNKTNGAIEVIQPSKVKKIGHPRKYDKTTATISEMNRNLETNSMPNNDWNKCIKSSLRKAVVLDTSDIVPKDMAEYDRFWTSFLQEVKKAKHLKCVNLSPCSVLVVQEIFDALPWIQTFKATSIQSLQLVNGTNNGMHEEVDNDTDNKINNGGLLQLSLCCLESMKNVTELRLRGVNQLFILNFPPSLKTLKHLKTFELTSVRVFPEEAYKSLSTLTTNLMHLELGECDGFGEHLVDVLKRLVNLRKLRLEYCAGKWTRKSINVFDAIKCLKELESLELVNIEFPTTVKNKMKMCENIKNLLIIPTYGLHAGKTNQNILECFKMMSDQGNLTRLVWGLPFSFNSASETGIQDTRNIDDIPFKSEEDNGATTSMVSIEYLHSELSKIFHDDKKCKVMKVDSKATTRVHFADLFDN